RARARAPAGRRRAAAPGPAPTGRGPGGRGPRTGRRSGWSADLGTVTGTERVRFVPDLPVREVVFRLTANTPTAAREGTAVTVQRAGAEPAGQPFRYERAGAAAGSVGGGLVIPLGREAPAGRPGAADGSFTPRL